MGARQSAIRNQYFHQTGNAEFRATSGHMHGLRQTMEDTVLTCPNLTNHTNFSIFGVFDGHCGSETAVALRDRIPDLFSKCKNMSTSTLTRELVELDKRICDEMLEKSPLSEESLDPDELKKRYGPAYKPVLLQKSITSGSTGVMCILEKLKGQAADEANAKLDVEQKSRPIARSASYSSSTESPSTSQKTESKTKSKAHSSESKGKAKTKAKTKIQEGTPRVVYALRCANVGDSRCILLRRKDDGTYTCIKMSNDHLPSREEEKERICKLPGPGVIANRVRGQLAVSRAYGDVNYKNNPNVDWDQQAVIAVPEWTTTNVRTGDIILMFCDGVNERMKLKDVFEMVTYLIITAKGSDFSKAPSVGELKHKINEGVIPELVLSRLMDLSLKHGSTDNMSVQMIEIGHGCLKDRHVARLHSAPVIDGVLENKHTDIDLFTPVFDDLLNHESMYKFSKESHTAIVKDMLLNHFNPQRAVSMMAGKTLAQRFPFPQSEFAPLLAAETNSETTSSKANSTSSDAYITPVSSPVKKRKQSKHEEGTKNKKRKRQHEDDDPDNDNDGDEKEEDYDEDAPTPKVDDRAITRKSSAREDAFTPPVSEVDADGDGDDSGGGRWLPYVPIRRILSEAHPDTALEAQKKSEELMKKQKAMKRAISDATTASASSSSSSAGGGSANRQDKLMSSMPPGFSGWGGIKLHIAPSYSSSSDDDDDEDDDDDTKPQKKKIKAMKKKKEEEDDDDGEPHSLDSSEEEEEEEEEEDKKETEQQKDTVTSKAASKQQ